MNRRQFLATGSAASLLPCLSAVAQPAALSKTRWVVRGSEAYDALGFLAPLAGDPFYTRYYEREIAEFAPRLPASTMELLHALRAEVAANDGLLSPNFYLRFSGGPDDNVDDLLRSIERADEVLRPALMASPYWGDEGEAEWRRFKARLPALKTILQAMMASGFRAFRAGIFDAKAATRLPQVRERLAAVDVVSECERYTGRTLEPTIEVVLLEFCKPHGVKVIGQKFLTGIGYSDDITIRTAAHEMLHPPVDMDGAAARAALAILQEDALIARVIAERDRSYGYGTVQGLMDEDLVEALDQIIGERLGVAADVRQRWPTHDGGMHVLAPAFYTLMQRSGFARTGGNLEAWLLNAARSGWLHPVSLHGAAAPLLGRPADQLWPPPSS